MRRIQATCSCIESHRWNIIFVHSLQTREIFSMPWKSDCSKCEATFFIWSMIQREYRDASFFRLLTGPRSASLIIHSEIKCKCCLPLYFNPNEKKEKRKKEQSFRSLQCSNHLLHENVAYGRSLDLQLSPLVDSISTYKIKFNQTSEYHNRTKQTPVHHSNTCQPISIVTRQK